MSLGPEIVKDPSAANNLAARTPGNHRNWSIIWDFPPDLTDLGPWHAYAVVRIVSKSPAGDACRLIVLVGNPVEHYIDHSITKIDHSITKRIKELGDSWQTVDMGVYDLNSRRLLVTPCGNPDEVEAIYVDRFFLVRESE